MVRIDLTGRVALVTGASRGLGAEIARTLGRAGAAVAVNYHQGRDAAQEVVAAIEAEGGRALAVQGDVSEPASVDTMFQAVRQGLGPVTVLVNNAGREERLAAPDELTWDDFQRMLDLNLRAVYETVRQARPDMQAAGWGRVVNIGSVAFNRPFPGSAAYTAAKGAMLGVTRSLAAELGSDGITANYLAPGWIPVARHATAPAEALENLQRETSLGRIGKPEEVAGAVLFLCSDLSSFITGVNLPVNGGHGGFW